ncbi:MAG: helix-turn-helix domain-containing protein [Ruminococcaceae bacterium]|nr:helix-turn-helix domain-containing protein [Oscillospiraceae bacterium]
MEKLTLSVAEAAAVVGISVRGMYDLVKTQGFPTIKIRNRLLVSAPGLTRWLEEKAEKGYTGQ